MEQGLLWSKKLVQGVPQIQPYKITAIYSEVQKPVEPINNSTDILAEIRAMRAEIDSLKGGINESNAKYANGSIEKSKSSGI